MEKIMKVKAVSALKTRSYPDKSTGAEVTLNWVEVTMTDGIDTVVGELLVPKTRDEQGKLVNRQPEIYVERLYGVSLQIDGASGVTEDGKEWSRNRINIKKLTAL